MFSSIGTGGIQNQVAKHRSGCVARCIKKKKGEKSLERRGGLTAEYKGGELTCMKKERRGIKSGNEVFTGKKAGYEEGTR